MEMLQYCQSVFSVELPENSIEIRVRAFSYCCSLRNVAFPPNAIIDDNVLAGVNTMDLNQLFNSSKRIIWELQHRFDKLPVHSVVYYQSYHQRVLQRLLAATNSVSCQRRTFRGKMDPTVSQQDCYLQDCLGMTPLHILACSSVHDLELYRVIVEKYPTTLITEDKWGALPLLYAFWGAAPAEIIQFLLESYQSLYPSHAFNWTMMVETIGRCDTPKECIENLLHVKQMHFPEQPIDWGYLLDNFAQQSKCYMNELFFDRKRTFLFTCGLSDCVKALPFKVWSDCISNMIRPYKFTKYGRDNSGILRGIRAKLDYFDEEFHKLKQVTTILEIVLWKMKINENSSQEMATQSQKKTKTDESSSRQQCRLTCGADVVIGHVLPFLITANAIETMEI
jgi:hypothetical protein